MWVRTMSRSAGWCEFPSEFVSFPGRTGIAQGHRHGHRDIVDARAAISTASSYQLYDRSGRAIFAKVVRNPPLRRT